MSSISLDEIITTQIDEPQQKNCVYRVRQQAKKQMTADEPQIAITKFTQIRVKSIKFLETDAIAIYFYDMTYHIESQNLENNVDK